MKRNVVIDSFRPGLEGAFLRVYAELTARDRTREVWLLAGSEPLTRYLPRMIAEKTGGVLNLQTFTFPALVNRLAPAASATTQLPDLLMTQIRLARIKNELPEGHYFKAPLDMPGTQAAAAATLNDLREANISPDDFDRAVKNASDARMKALTDLARREEEGRLRHFADDGISRMESATKNIDLQTHLPDHLLVYGLYDFTGIQLRFIEALRAAVDTTIFFPYEPTPTWSYARPGLVHLAGNELPPPGSVHSLGKAAVRVISCPGAAREAEVIAREVLHLAEKEKVPMPRIGILLRNPAQYGPLIAQTLDQHEIPYFRGEKIPLSETRSGAFLFSLLRIVETDYSRRAVIELLTSFDLSRIAANAKGFWDALTRWAGVVRGRNDWKKLDHLADLLNARLKRAAEKNANDDDRFNPERTREQLADLNTLKQIVEKLIEGLHRVGRATTWTEAATAMAEVFVETAPKDDDVEAVAEKIRSLTRLEEAGPGFQASELNHWVRELLQAERIRTGAARYGTRGVYLGSLMGVRGVPFDVVFLPGMKEGAFPHRPISDPLLGDEDRKRINENRPFTGKLPLKATSFDEERLLFRLACTAAKKQLILTFPRLDAAGGRPQLPSSFVLNLARTIEGRTVGFGELDATSPLEKRWSRLEVEPLDRLGPPAAPPARMDQLALERIGQARRSGTLDPVKELPAMLPLNAQALKCWKNRWDSDELTVYDGLVESAGKREVGRACSPTRMEAYARCPFHHFLQHVMRLEVLDPPEDAVRADPRGIGLTLHRLLRTFFSDLKERGELPIRPDRVEELTEELLQGAEKELNTFARNESTGLELPWELLKEELLAGLAKLVELEAETETALIPDRFEVAFGRDPTEPFTLHITPDFSLNLQGKFDRVDVSADGSEARIVDYKTAKPENLKKPAGFDGGQNLQLALYLLAYLEQSGRDVKVSGELLSLKNPEKSREVSIADLEPRREELAKLLGSLLAGLGEGAFHANPDSQQCRYCDYRLACGAGLDPILRRKSPDPRLVRFREMKKKIT